jgi:hypothetical protein
MERSALRIDLTDYREYIQALRDRLNEDGAYKMSMTDAVKICIEQAAERLMPDVKVNKTRKRYIKIPF